ncbi:phosphatase PAP2 family protein [Amycolatopsis sp.]|uniref:phosphatase PAP2 family protein n=1 Tax=Amycolatopsis sp. TaxID=37632 RepID=UPI002B6934D7|nr:phosphatase PAP2 family protein [Amycolatopsis sp.]HVV09248.1 phosphatase PAP2 family protein [Amycolatopsis sp.]
MTAPATVALAFVPYGGGVPAHQSVLLDLFVAPTEPYVLIPLVALMTVLCGLQRQWRDAVLCVLGAVVPVLLNTFVLKFVFAHHLDDYLAYPSGHSVSLVAPLTVLVLLAGQGIARVVTFVVAAVVTVLAGIGLVGLGYHYPLDVVGGACFAVAAVLTLSLLLRPAPAPSGGSPRAGTSSGSPPAASPR